ncbi:MAG: hypothetical protein J0I42_18110 [Bosea sp.]|uniref:hypothetical protein n=1 Tax=Bosea sp. (in: a-proteobacteria) TaxID=1871050 RepID=UPI001ACF72B3|nr:hypothetical protein [Bosea sp. (in: a-proteobacteria)]MBN9453857.1 hypothetical protein [Bosea sp. (in: a-proteobacteria)]
MKSTILARIVKLEMMRRPGADENAERREVANWAAANPEEASRLIAEVSARLLGDGKDCPVYVVPPKPAAVHDFFMEGL